MSSALVDAVHAKLGDDLGVSKALVGKVADAVVSHITDTIAKDGKVAVPSLGVFSVRARKGRDGRNPRTGAPLKIAPSKNVGYKAAKGLRDLLNGRSPAPKTKAAKPAKAAKKGGKAK